MVTHVDILRALHGCTTDAQLAERCGYSQPTLSRWRKHGIPAAKRELIAEELRREDRAVPDELLRPQVAADHSEAA